MTSSNVHRVESDGNGPRAKFEDIVVGKLLGEVRLEVTRELIQRQCEMDNDYDPWYLVDSPYGSAVAPPQIQYRPPRWLLSRSYNVRGLFVKWKMENIAPVREGSTVVVTGRISDKYVRKDREYIEYTAEGRDEDGSLLFRTTRTHVLDVLPRTAPRAGVGIDSGLKPERI